MLKAKKTTNWKRWGLIAGGILLLLLAFLVAGLWTEDRGNAFLAMGFVVFGVGGGFLIFIGWSRRTERNAVIVGANKATEATNSLNIYATKDKDTGILYADKIAFEWIDEPLGQPMQCLNSGKWYHVHIFDLVTEKLKPFVLPDAQYFDPSEFACVLAMPAHKRLFERRPGNIAKWGPWAMVVALLIAVIGMVITTPTPPA